MKPRKALVLVNVRARQGKAQLKAVEEALERHGMDYELVQLTKGVDIAKLISKHKTTIDRVIVGGGDGTLNTAAEGVLASGLPLGILPLGTANDLARTLGLPSDVEGAVEVISGETLRTIDVGDVNGKLFFNVASVGFSAELARNLTREAKRTWGVLGYALTAVKLLWGSKPFGAKLAYGNKSDYVNTLQVAVGNGYYYGGGMKVAADARPDDGHLDVYSLEVNHWLEMAAIFPMLRAGTHAAWPTVRGLRVGEFELTTRKPMPVNADGEIVTMTPAVFSIRRQAVKVFVKAT